MLGIMYDVVARISILNNGLTFPTASGELELGGQMQTEVDGGNAVVKKIHLDALRFPIAQRILVTCDENFARQALAAKLNMDSFYTTTPVLITSS